MATRTLETTMLTLTLALFAMAVAVWTIGEMFYGEDGEDIDDTEDEVLDEELV